MLCYRCDQYVCAECGRAPVAGILMICAPCMEAAERFEADIRAAERQAAGLDGR